MTVVAATEVMHGRPCYEVEFSRREIIVADAAAPVAHLDPPGTAIRRRRRLGFPGSSPTRVPPRGS